jgi:dTDP-4-amino-4,6-dideoxy-D-galactose acyltransferase
MTLPDAVDEPDLWVRLPWDSNHFGFPIGRILPTSLSYASLSRALAGAEAAGTRCLYWLSDPDDSQVADGERVGFKVVDVRVELIARLASQKVSRIAATTIREVGESDLVPLKALASTSHRNTRFYRDGSFPTDRADQLYAEWIEKSFQDPKQEVLASGPAGQPSGYIASGVSDDGHGVIGLIAVDESRRGTGLGSALVSAAMGRLAQQGIEQVTVVTQGDNQPAHRLYNALGFSERSRFVWLHRWFEA